ncbi:hypothetical protein [Nocardioides marmoribigeumensis]|uniref:Uncharacterized protein n=1 Tax=Nocardioides marmoribigeumensis TaxID=433649 RepID=A0ABU2BVJ5_9ACTN|nr:hypothetical protein [Nocardioides marmoribigeumensis]MDR7362291.1 hypothetical protein [Nocardioides marmoribigeumensis]
MKELQTLALGLVIVFVDVSTPDWVADPFGWILVLIALAAIREQLPDYRQVSLAAWTSLALSVVTWPESSVAHVDGWLELLFGLPVLAFCFLLCDSLIDVTIPEHAARFRALCWAFAVLVLAPVAIYGLGWDWLQLPATIAGVAANLALVLVLFGASDEDAYVPAGSAAEEDGLSERSRDGSADREAADSEDRGKHRA